MLGYTLQSVARVINSMSFKGLTFEPTLTFQNVKPFKHMALLLQINIVRF